MHAASAKEEKIWAEFVLRGTPKVAKTVAAAALSAARRSSQLRPPPAASVSRGLDDEAGDQRWQTNEKRRRKPFSQQPFKALTQHCAKIRPWRLVAWWLLGEQKWSSKSIEEAPLGGRCSSSGESRKATKTTFKIFEIFFCIKAEWNLKLTAAGRYREKR